MCVRKELHHKEEMECLVKFGGGGREWVMCVHGRFGREKEMIINK